MLVRLARIWAASTRPKRAQPARMKGERSMRSIGEPRCTAVGERATDQLPTSFPPASHQFTTSFPPVSHIPSFVLCHSGIS